MLAASKLVAVPEMVWEHRKAPIPWAEDETQAALVSHECVCQLSLGPVWYEGARLLVYTHHASQRYRSIV